ncbi:hypothetical protein COL922a_009525 [Colletotrichum nupharicola]|nr:hypothetical protein COL922a_009525 [Colletotrichum nupharicola]
MTISTLIHWLLSNALFVVVVRGSYFEVSNFNDAYGFQEDPISLPKDAAISIGTASLPVLVLAVLCAVLLVIPIAISRKTLPGHMPVVGSSSYAISLACRVSPLARVCSNLRTASDDQDSNEGREEVGESLESVREKMTLDRLKWGEVKMPEDWYHQEDDGQISERVGHLSFGTVFDNPKPPSEGRLYR